MTRGVDDLLEDLAEAADAAAELVRFGTKRWDTERPLCLAGEAIIGRLGDIATKLPDKVVEATPEIPGRQVKGMRIIAAPAYHRIDYEEAAMRTRLAACALGAVAAALLGAAGCSSQVAASAGTQQATAIPASVPEAASASHPCGTQAKPGAYRHVIWIWMENHSSAAIIGSSQAPYLSTLARECGLATNYHNITHPSLPNYVAATSGLSYSALQGFLPDCDPSAGCDTPARSIFGQGETWRAYEESMPSDCDHGNSGDYAVRHNPAVYYTTLHGCSAADVSYSHLATDLAHNQLPAFSFITPNLIDDMHDGTVADGDMWLSRNLPAMLGSAEYRSGSTVIFITWDEGEGGGYASGEHCATNITDVSCQIATLVISPSTKAGTRSGTLFNHYSLLATAEQLLGLPKLGLAAAYPAMTEAFNL